MYTVSHFVHFKVAKLLEAIGARSVLDVGGTGKLKLFYPGIVNANLKRGVDGCHLPYGDNSFDAVVSIATLEHVHSAEQFLRESLRVCSKLSVHWFPFGNDGKMVEGFKKSIRYIHPCQVLDLSDLVKILGMGTFQTEPLISAGEHLLTLVQICTKIDRRKVYEFLSNHPQLGYGTLLKVLKK